MNTTPQPPEAARQTFAAALAASMETRGYDRRQLREHLAEQAGVKVTEQAIGAWLRAERHPRPETVAALRELLGGFAQ